MALPIDSIVDSPARLSESFRNEDWLRAHPLNSSTVLDYVSGSPFWQAGCNNEIARMQGTIAPETMRRANSMNAGDS
jgi:hypothetical protein